MSAGRHKSRTADPRDKLTTAERQHAYQIGLSREVSTACERWLRARGIAPQAFNPFDGLTTPPGDSNAPQAILAPTAAMPAPRGEDQKFSPID